MTLQLARVGTRYKRCPRCWITKRADDFRKNKNARDGLQNYCAPCQIEVNRISRLKNKENNRKRHIRYQTAHAEQERRRKKEWQRLNRAKVRAHKRVARALESGRLKRPDKCGRCGLDEFAIHAHHEDYAKPLVVIWLCAPCHQQRHKELAELSAAHAVSEQVA